MAVRITSSGGLAFVGTMDDSQILAAVRRVMQETGNMSRTVQQHGNQLETVMRRATGALAAYFSFQGGKELVNQLIEVRGQFQQIEIAFTTMLQSKQKANELMAEMVDLAVQTPFKLSEVTSGAKQLLAYGTQAEDITKTLTMLGNVASGVSAPLGDIIYLYGTLQTQGRAYAVDIRQFAGRGIPIYAELAKVLGVTKDKVSELVEAGQVGFPQVEKAFQNMTSSGGMFYNLMQEQAKSLTGQISNLQDKIALMFNEIGKGNEGLLSGGIQAAAYLVEHYKDIAHILGILVTTYGAYKVAVALVSLAETQRAKTLATHSALLGKEVRDELLATELIREKAIALQQEAIAEANSAKVKLESLRVDVAKAAATRERLTTIAVEKTQLTQHAAVQSSLAAKELAIAQQIAASDAQRMLSKANLTVLEKQQAVDRAVIQANLAAKEVAAAKLTGDVRKVEIAEKQAALAMEQRFAAERQAVRARDVAAEIQANGAKGAVRVAEKAQMASNTAVKKLADAQDAATIARQNALAASTIFGTSKRELETAAVGVNTAMKKAATATNSAMAAAENATTFASTRLTLAQHAQALATTITTRAQALLNATMLSNPIVATIAIVGGLVAAYFALRDTTTAAERAQTLFDDSLKRTNESADELKNKTQQLVGIINDDNQVKATQILAYQQLQQLFPGRLSNLDLEALKLKASADQQKILNGFVQEFSLENLKKEYADALNNAEKLSTITIQLGDGTTSTQDNTMSKEYEAAALAAEKIKGEIIKVEEAEKLANMTSAERITYMQQQADSLYKQINLWGQNNDNIKIAEDGSISLNNVLAGISILPLINQFNTLIGQINSAKKAIDPNAPILSIDDADTKIKILKDDKDKATDQATRDRLTKQITDLENLRDKMDGTSAKRAAKTAATNARRIEKEQENTKEKQTKFLTDLSLEEEKYTNKIAYEGSKQLADLKDKYEKMRQAAIEKGFSKTKDSGVFQRIDNLEQKETGGLKYDKDTKDLLESLDKQKQLYSDFESYKTEVGETEAKKRYENLIDVNSTFAKQLENEKKKIGVDGVAGTSSEQERLLQLNSRIVDANKEVFDKETNLRAKALADFASYQDKRSKIIYDYNKEIKALGENATEEQKAEAERQKKIALGQLADDYAQRLTESKSFFDGLVLMSRQAVQGQIKNIERLLELSNLDPDTRKKLKNDLAETKKLLKVDPEELELVQLKKQLREVDDELQRINDNTPESVQRKAELMVRRTNLNSEITEKNLTGIDKILNKISKAVPVLAALGDSLSSIGGEGSGLAEIGAGLSTIAGGLQNFSDTYKKAANKEYSFTHGYTAAAQFASQLITTIADAAKRRKQAEEEFYANALGMQSQYNLGLIETHRLSAELSENVFLTDYFGRAKKGMEAAIMAMASYQAAMDKLSEGKSKVRQKNVVDGKTVGQLALSGAAAGAVIGAVVFSAVGAAVGAVIGGIVGAIGGLFSKKKKDVYGGLLEQYPELLRQGANGVREINVELAKSLIANNQLDAKTKELVQSVLNAKDAYEAAHKQMSDVVKDLAGNMGNELRTALVDAWKAGEDGAIAFGKVVNNTLENILTNLLFHAAFNGLFTELQKDLTDGFVNQSIGDITDAMGDFATKAKERMPLWEASMGAIDEMMKKAGLEGISRGQKAGSNNSVSGAIQQITQQQADVLTGQFYAQTTVLNDINAKIPKTYFIDSIIIMNQQFDVLNKIEKNTSDTAGNTKGLLPVLESIDKKMNNTANQAAAAGYKI